MKDTAYGKPPPEDGVSQVSALYDQSRVQHISQKKRIQITRRGRNFFGAYICSAMSDCNVCNVYNERFAETCTCKSSCADRVYLVELTHPLYELWSHLLCKHGLYDVMFFFSFLLCWLGLNLSDTPVGIARPRSTAPRIGKAAANISPADASGLHIPATIEKPPPTAPRQQCDASGKRQDS